MVSLPLRTERPSGSTARRRPRRLRRLVLLAAVVLVLGAGGAAWAWWVGAVGPVPIRDHCTATAAGATTQLDPEQMGNAAVITEIAVRRGLPGRAASIAIATAMQESKLRNIEYGDRDSMGLFQQRPSQGWGTKAQILDPVYATNSFYDHLVKIDGYVNMPITQVAQKIQRSAFPTAYADHEPDARIIASALSGYSPAGLSCVLHAAASKGSAAAVLAAAGTETGRTGAADGGSVRFDTGASSGNRSAWALGQWAVARAGGLNVTAVQVGDRRWARARSTDGWTAAGSALPAGVVVVQV